MDHLEAAALAAAASATITTVNSDIKINSLDPSHISGSLYDDVSMRESMVRSRSGSSSSVNFSVDLQQGLTASSTGQNLRRGSSTVRNQSPHASRERYTPYSATSPRSPRSPFSPQASTSPFLVHSPPPPTPSSSTSNFLSAPPLSPSPSYASHNVLSSGSPSVQLGPARAPQHLQSPNRHEQLAPQQQQQQEQAAFGHHLHRHSSSEGVPASESWTGHSLSSESSGRSPSSYPFSSHFPPSWSFTPRQASYPDHPNSHPDSKRFHLHRDEPHPHHHHPASQYHSSTLSNRQGAERSTTMSQDYPERIGYHREDEASHQYRQHQYLHQSPQQHHHHHHQPRHSQHHARSGRSQDRYKDPRSEHPVDRIPQYFHASNTSQAPTSIHIHHGSSSSAAHNAFGPFSQPAHRSSRHPHSHGQEHHSQQQQHAYTSHPSRHHSMISEHAERTLVSSHVNPGEPSSSSRGPPYGVSRTSSSSFRLPPHSSFSTASSSSVSGSMSIHASSSTSAAGAGSAVRLVPAGSTTSPVAMTVTASGEIKTMRRRRRPNESYSTIIIKAIRNSPLQRLKLSEIYDCVSREIPTMDGNDKGWQNTVRHNLSHNKCFRRIVIKDEDLPSESADDDNGDSKPNSTGKSSKQAKRGKGGCWVLVPENLEESMSSSRPKKSSIDQVQSLAAPGAGSDGLISSTNPKSHTHHTAGGTGGATIPKATISSIGGAYLSPQLSKDYVLSHPHSAVMDIDRNVASMTIAEQQLQQYGHHHSPHMHPSHYTPPHPHSQYSSQSGHTHAHHQHQHHHASYLYLPPHYPSSSSSSPTVMMNQPGSSSAAFQSFTAITRPGQHNYNGSGDERDHDSESDDGQSGHSVLSADRETDDDDDCEGDEVMDAMMEDDSVSHSSSTRQSPSRSPSALSLSATSSPMEIEEADGGNGGMSSSSPPTIGRLRPGMSIQNMLN